MVAVTVRAASVPTDVSEDARTFAAKVAPVKVPAAAAIVIGAVPSKFTPLIALAVCSAVAVAALPLIEPAMVLLKVCVPDQVGEMPTSIGGAASERIYVLALPFTTARPTEAVGLAGLTPPDAGCQEAVAPLLVRT